MCSYVRLGLDDCGHVLYFSSGHKIAEEQIFSSLDGVLVVYKHILQQMSNFLQVHLENWKKQQWIVGLVLNI